LLRLPIQALASARAKPGRFLFLTLVFLFLAFGVWVLSWRAYGWHHYLAGKRSLAVDQCREALDHFQQSLSIWPDDAGTLFLAARAARRLGDFETADRYLTKCQASPALADAAARERILLRAGRGEIDDVGELCHALLEEDGPDTPLVLEALAQGNMAMLRYHQADLYLDRWLEKTPDHPYALYLKGRLHLYASHNQEAIDLLRRSIELDPDRDDARLLLAGLHLDLGQPQEALQHLEAVCRREPHNMQAQARLAQTLVLLGRQEEAVRLLDEVLRKRPDLASALLERGKLALRDDDLDRAEDLLQKACKRDPGNRAAHYQLLQCLKRRGKTNEIGAVQQRLDKIDRDAQRMDEIVKLLPKRGADADLQAELGEILLNIGAYDQGVGWLERAIRLDPRHAGAHRALARYYQELGQVGRARHHRALAGGEPASTPK
jgi:tetratricopeptide (TPR) repeat protein